MFVCLVSLSVVDVVLVAGLTLQILAIASIDTPPTVATSASALSDTVDDDDADDRRKKTRNKM